MTRAQKFLRCAVKCVELADYVDEKSRSLFMEMAVRWFELAALMDELVASDAFWSDDEPEETEEVFSVH
jgi:hypothetical protein